MDDLEELRGRIAEMESRPKLTDYNRYVLAKLRDQERREQQAAVQDAELVRILSKPRETMPKRPR